MITTTLSSLETWFREPTEGNDRPKLLSKLALLELCGWLEIELDRILMECQKLCLNDENWVNKNIIENTNGFHYDKHFRPMVAKVFGEHITRKIEAELEGSHAGELERLRSITGQLWRTRCSFAHADMHANVRRQARFDAPSWSQNQQRIIAKILTNIEAVMKKHASSV